MTIYTLHSDRPGPTPYIRTFTERSAAILHIDHLGNQFENEHGDLGNADYWWRRYDPAKNDRLCISVEMRVETNTDTDVVENLTLFEEHFGDYEKTAQKGRGDEHAA